MNATTILAYAYSADIHCPLCAINAYVTGDLLRNPAHPYANPGEDEHGLPRDLVDREGNVIGPLFSCAVEQTEHCGDCGRMIDGTEHAGTPDDGDAPDMPEEFFVGYVECALWSSSDTRPGGGEGDYIPLDQWDGDLTPATLAAMREDCAHFWRVNCHLMRDLDADRCGHDFWLTRNGHGAGFWDRGLGRRGDLLTEACRPWGSYDLCIGDDGAIHGS